MPQSLGLGPTNTLRLNSLTSLVFKIIFNPQPPVMQIGKLEMDSVLEHLA